MLQVEGGGGRTDRGAQDLERSPNCKYAPKIATTTAALAVATATAALAVAI